MKNIKFFKYKNTCKFANFLSSYEYKLEDIEGFCLAGQKQYHGNIFKIYDIWFKDGSFEIFKVAYFKSFNEYHQSRLGFNGNKLLGWYENADVKGYKLEDGSYSDKWLKTKD